MISLALTTALFTTYNWKFAPADGPLDNPLKGWAPFVVPQTKINVPYDMAYFNVSWKELEPTEGQFAFEQWEKSKWELPAAKGKRIVFRLILDYPGDPSGIPDWLLKKGLKSTPYTDHGGGNSPDYNNPYLQRGVLKLIQEMGKRYDASPRVGFIQLGTLGFWGEWHTWPRLEMFASEALQKQVVGAYQKAFPNKMLMARNPIQPVASFQGLGWHDDMIPQDTLGPEDWQFLPNMKANGQADSWTIAPRGGEMVPAEVKDYTTTKLGTTMRAIDEAHFSWIGPASPPLLEATPELTSNMNAMVRKMGYQYSLTSATTEVEGGSLTISLRGANQGVAPFYYPWKAQLVLVGKDNRPVQTSDTNWDIRSWLPGGFEAKAQVSTGQLKGSYRLALGIIDPLTGNPNIRFANQLQTIDGWAILGQVQIR